MYLNEKQITKSMDGCEKNYLQEFKIAKRME